MKRIAVLLAAVAVLTLAASACAPPSLAAKHAAPSAGSHACADQLAQATVATVPNLASCLDGKFTSQVEPSALKPFAKSWRYIGEVADDDSANGTQAYLYEITYKQTENGMTAQLLIVYEDDKGLVSGAGVSNRIV